MDTQWAEKADEATFGILLRMFRATESPLAYVMTTIRVARYLASDGEDVLGSADVSGVRERTGV